jgi:NAD(P)-dependent dehydrogenase (short-subunit alcohol dehydrogenase family)
MTDHSNHTALVTGATSGLGLEAAAQLAASGYRRVIITGRNTERAKTAADQLARQTGRDVFETLVVDFNIPTSVDEAAAEITTKGLVVDALLLNAGMVSGSTQVRTDAGVEVTYASSLIGHHRFTMRLLADESLAADARIVIAGSEAARDDVPTFSIVDLPALAAKSFGGDREAAAEALIRGDAPAKYKPADTYATAKLFVAWWAAQLAGRLPEGMTVNAVSPGSAPNTGAARNANFFMRNIMMPVFKHAPKRFGMAATTDVAAARYIDALDFDVDVNGQFFASAPKKMTGPLHRMEQPHLFDVESQEAAWAATVEVAGVGVPASV